MNKYLLAAIIIFPLVFESCGPENSWNDSIVEAEQIDSSSHIERSNSDQNSIHDPTGNIIPEQNIKISTHEISELETFEEPQLNAQIYLRTKTIQLSGEPKLISYGHGSFPDITVLKLGEPKKINVQAEITPALPFQNVIHNKLSYKTLGISQGLKAAFITSVYQDSRGYFWFGSRRGLTRYDAHSFHYYSFANDDQHRGIGAITEDSKGNLWMTFGSFGGLVKFDGHNFYEYKEGAGLNLGEKYLGIVHSDKKGNMWLKSETQIIRFDGENFTCFPYRFQDLKNLNVIIKENQEGNFWLSALGGVCSIEGDEMKYFALEELSENNLCHPIIEDERGLIVVTGTGVTILKNDSLHIFPVPFIKEHSIRNTLVIENNFILASEQKKNAICSIDDSVLTIMYDNTPVFSDAQPLFVDSFDNVWLGTSGKGIQCYNPKEFKYFKFEELEKGGNISSILEDKSGNVWFGSHGFGLYKFDGKNHHYIELIEGQSEITIRSLIQDDQDNIWVGTVNYGFYKIEEQTQKVTRYNCFEGEDFHVFALTQDNDHNVWIGTQHRGLIKYDGEEFIHYLPFDLVPNGNSGNIRALLTDSKGNVWIGMDGGGLLKYDGGNFHLYNNENGLSSNHVVSLMEKSDGSIWIGTGDNGVNKFKDGIFTQITMDDGLSSNAIWTISEDEEENIWLGADKCLNVLLAKSDTATIYRIKTFCDLGGLVGAEFYANSGFMDHKNQLWWGTDQMAVLAPNPKNLLIQGDLKIALEEINVVNNRVDFKQLQDTINSKRSWFIDAGNQLDLADLNFESVSPFVNCPNRLELPQKMNDLTFIYSVNGTKSPNDVKFQYFIEGIDKNWSIPSIDNSITYRGIPAGTHTLQTKVSEIKGIWSEPHTYTFVVLPFWWKTWWAYSIWGILILALIGGVNILLNKRRKEKANAKHLKEIDVMKSQLYANITHEFRTPLTLIIGMNDQIQGHDKEKAIIRRNSEKLLLQINQLLDTSKLESGNLKLSINQSDIIGYIQLLSESFYSLADDKGIKLTVYSEVTELMMDFDEQKVQGIIYNLLSNAIKFTPKGGTIVFHLSEQLSKKRKELRIKIKDNGVGIKEDELDKIFDRFYQADNLQKRTNTGTGIGLALTKSLIELMGGNISVQSTIEKGTEFTLFLPIENKGPRVDANNFSKPVGWASESKVKRTYIDKPDINDHDALHLVIVEDNIEIANYLIDIFQNSYVVHIAENGKSGVDLIYDIIPDAVISDIAMPEMDGYELCDIIKSDERTSHIPIILLTAKTSQAEKLDGLKIGADTYLTKPFDKEELEISLQKLIDLRKGLQKYYSKISELAEGGGKEKSQLQRSEEVFLEKLTLIIENNLTDSDFGVPDLATKLGVNQMQVYRKLKALTDKTPSQFIRSYRLNKSLELLKNGEMNISEIAYEVGFSDPNYFSRTFHREFGNPPGSFRN